MRHQWSGIAVIAVALILAALVSSPHHVAVTWIHWRRVALAWALLPLIGLLPEWIDAVWHTLQSPWPQWTTLWRLLWGILILLDGFSRIPHSRAYWMTLPWSDPLFWLDTVSIAAGIWGFIAIVMMAGQGVVTAKAGDGSYRDRRDHH